MGQKFNLTQVWYAYNAEMASELPMIATLEQIIMDHGPVQCYYTKTFKLLLICKGTVSAKKLKVFREFSYQHLDSECYAKRFIGFKERHQEWLAPNV